MTFQWHNLLAADDDGLVNILILVVLMVIGLVGHLIKKAQEKQQAEKADRKVDDAKRRHPPTAAQQDDALQAALVGQTEPPPPPPPRQPVAGVELQPIRADLARGVHEEVRKVKRHLSVEQADRRRRLGHVEDLKSGIDAKPAQAKAVTGDKPKIRLNLTSPKAARTAIICAEVLGPPKSLRTDPEPWE